MFGIDFLAEVALANPVFGLVRTNCWYRLYLLEVQNDTEQMYDSK